MVQENDLHRKSFLQLSARMALGLAGILGLGGLARYFSHKEESGKPSQYELCAVSDFPASGVLVREDIPAVIYRTADGFSAYSLVCTHLGCSLEADGENFSCPCHGSRFDQDGAVLKGPAAERLRKISYSITDDGVLILEAAEDGI